MDPMPPTLCLSHFQLRKALKRVRAVPKHVNHARQVLSGQVRVVRGMYSVSVPRF